MKKLNILPILNMPLYGFVYDRVSTELSILAHKKALYVCIVHGF